MEIATVLWVRTFLICLKWNWLQKRSKVIRNCNQDRPCHLAPSLHSDHLNTFMCGSVIVAEDVEMLYFDSALFQRSWGWESGSQMVKTLSKSSDRNIKYLIFLSFYRGFNSKLYQKNSVQRADIYTVDRRTYKL